MDLYSLLRPALFSLEPERAHELSMQALRLRHFAGSWIRHEAEPEPVRLAGLSFPNRIGLAAGADKNGRFLDALGGLGFGFVEIGTMTPRPQPGKPRPRLFRLTDENALINRMGFPNEGVEAIANRVAGRRFAGIVGANIGMNATTPLADSVADFIACLRRVHRVFDYVTVNISSPNTAGLRDLQEKARLRELFAALIEERATLAAADGRRVPIFMKLSPDMSDAELGDAATTALELSVDGIVAVNTTVSRDPVAGHPLEHEAGGLSGAPLAPLARRAIARLRTVVGDAPTLIGVGGVSTADDYCRLREAGADLVQVYTGLVFRGPRLVTEVLERERERASTAAQLVNEE